MKHTPWTEKDLIEARVASSYNGYKICKTFYSVLSQIEESKPTFYTLTFLQKDDSRKAIFTKREREIGGFYHKVVKELTFLEHSSCYERLCCIEIIYNNTADR